MTSTAAEAADGGLVIVQAWCPRCREMVLPMDDGRCCWCDTQTGGADPDPPLPPPPTRTYARKGDPEYGRTCLSCGGPKHLQSSRCIACRRANGWRGPTSPGLAFRRPRLISEVTLQEARVLYASGLSTRKVAAIIWPRTGYKTEASCADSLHSLFQHRGWPLRSLSEVTSARNYRHGNAPRGRDESAYRRWLKEQRGDYRPQCAGARTQYPRKGERCQRPALHGSDYCVSHDPARRDEMNAHLARIRARREAA